MKAKTIFLCTVSLSLGACSSYGEYSASGPRFMPRADISQSNSTQETRTEDDMDLVKYDKYEHREPCQYYRKMPRNHEDNCVVAEIVEEMVVADVAEPASTETLAPIVRSYTVLFDFDKSDVRQSAHATLDEAMNEIAKYQPTQVTVTGYTDSSGTDEYNQTLSHEREQAVSQALLERGISNRTLDHQARGEYEQAVRTADGVKNQENRRVVVDFRRQM